MKNLPRLDYAKVLARTSRLGVIPERKLVITTQVSNLLLGALMGEMVQVCRTIWRMMVFGLVIRTMTKMAIR